MHDALHAVRSTCVAPDTDHSIAVIKIGGSVLTGPDAYKGAASFIASRLAAGASRRLVVVVSAEFGVTDALCEMANGIASEPDPVALDLLWSTGELRSVALLVLALHAHGVDAVGLNVHQTGLAELDSRSRSATTQVRTLRLRASLARHAVVVVPGFLARTAADEIVSLGRGGSDLTAVLIAAALEAHSCELIKDVPGYFSTDPRQDLRARHLPTLSYGLALEMAENGCDLIQRQALETARSHGLGLIVRAVDDRRFTVISDIETAERASPRRRYLPSGTEGTEITERAHHEEDTKSTKNIEMVRAEA